MSNEHFVLLSSLVNIYIYAVLTCAHSARKFDRNCQDYVYGEGEYTRPGKNIELFETLKWGKQNRNIALYCEILRHMQIHMDIEILKQWKKRVPSN